MSYTIEEHKHRFSAWAAGRAASVNGCRFKVKQAKAILESAHMNQLLGDSNNSSTPQEIDNSHRVWRNNIIDAAKIQGFTFTHGIAEKLINIYLKAGFVCGGYHEHKRVQALHQPIDSVLLNELSAQDVGGFRRVWTEAYDISWSNFNSEQYETVIKNIRNALPNKGLCEVEQYWRGY